MVFIVGIGDCLFLEKLIFLIFCYWKKLGFWVIGELVLLYLFRLLLLKKKTVLLNIIIIVWKS